MRMIPIAIIAAGAALAQQGPDKLVIPITDPAKPKMLRVSMLTGSITVKGAAVKEVTVEVHSRGARETGSKGGMRRIGPSGGEVRAEEIDNTVRISVGHSNQPTDLVITVPRDTSLKLRSTNDGSISAADLEGEFDVNNLNGPVTLSNVSGTVIAHSLNGQVKVTMAKVDPKKPMSFSTLNGDVDVTLPTDTKASVKMKSDNGQILSDFEVTPSEGPRVEGGKRDAKGMYRVAIPRFFHGNINGGGQQIDFTTMNGTIYIRRK